MDDLCDKYRVPYHVRRDIHMKMFDGRSAFDLMNADRLEQHHIDALIAEARQMKWQPIETAPTDGTRILLRGRNGKIADGHYGQPDGFANPKRFVWPYINATPTHWAPLALMEQSNAKPTNDSAPHQFELELTESIVHTITIDANKAAPTTTIAVALPDGRFVYLPTNDSAPHQFELEFDDAP